MCFAAKRITRRNLETGMGAMPFVASKKCLRVGRASNSTHGRSQLLLSRYRKASVKGFGELVHVQPDDASY